MGLVIAVTVLLAVALGAAVRSARAPRCLPRSGGAGHGWRGSGRRLRLPAAGPLAGAVRSVAGATAMPFRAPDPAVAGDLAELRAVVAAGGSVRQGLEVVALGRGPWAEPARAVVVASQRGRSVQDGLDAWVEVSGDGEVALLAASLGIAGATGGSLARALDGVADAVAERRSLQREIRALSSQARASAAVLALTPVAFAVVVALVDARVRAFWLGTLAGPLTVVVGLLLDLAGAAWMASLVRRVR